MSNRRDFMKTALVVAGGVTLARFGKAHAMTDYQLPDGIIYTKDKPGRWAKKVSSHAPIVKIDGKKVTITTKHPMTAEHYIVRHTLVDEDGTILGEKTFYPTDKKAVSTYELKEEPHAKLYATSFCNKHDFWMTVVIP